MTTPAPGPVTLTSSLFGELLATLALSRNEAMEVNVSLYNFHAVFCFHSLNLFEM